MKIKKTPKNPHGLSAKQKLVVEDMVRKIRKGKPLKPVDSTKKFYDVGSEKMAGVITSTNMANPDFRAALMEGLEEREILGRNSLVEKKLAEGLDATTKMGMEIDYATRLRYIQEINKIAGVYAPEKKETKSLRLNVDISQEELDKRIKSLQKELDEV
jgi:hypothetical protein